MINYEKQIEEKGCYDVVVAGGGVAGVAAALSAIKNGKRVLLIEKSMKLGGLATLGLINLFVPMCNGRGKQIIFGMAEEFLRLSIKYGYGDVPKEFKNGKISDEDLKKYEKSGDLPPRYMTRYSAEIFALCLTELISDNGVNLLFDTVVTDVVAEEFNKKKVKGVIVENKSGSGFYKAKMFIDATGDADIMYKAGMPLVTRSNYHSYMGFYLTLKSCEDAVKHNDIGKCFNYFGGGMANLYGGGHPEGMPLYDGTNADDINRYLILNQKELLNKLKSSDRKYREISALPGMAQFRTTRRIEGDYTLKESDAYRHFEDSVGAICDFDRRDYLFEIPYSTLVRTGWDNIITVGRSAAGDGYAWDVLRVIPPAIITGQAAGNAVSMAIDDKEPIWNINIKKLQSQLESQNVVIHFDDADKPLKSRDIHENND